MKIDLDLLRAVACARATDPETSREALRGVLVVSKPGQVQLVASDGIVLFYGLSAAPPGAVTGSWVMHPETVAALCKDSSGEAFVDWNGGYITTEENFALPLKTIGVPFPDWGRVVPDHFTAGPGAPNGTALVNPEFVLKFIHASRHLISGAPGVALRAVDEKTVVAAIPGCGRFGAVISGLIRDRIEDVSIPKVI